MAAPATVTTRDLSGNWLMNKSLSHSTDDVFQAQKIGWILRRTLGACSISLKVVHTPATATAPEEIHIDQSLSGLKGTREERVLDSSKRPHEDYVFGKVVGQSKRLLTAAEIGDAWLEEGGWTEDTVRDGWVRSFVESTEYGWTAEQIWGFQVVEGERRYVRRLKFVTAEGKRLDKVLVYDWVV